VDFPVVLRRLDKYQASKYSFAGGALLLICLPVFLSPLLASEILIFAIFALGYNILLGYGGEMSFGHAAYFGLGAYGVILTAYVIPNIYVAILAGVALATVAGVVFGWLSLQRRGIYFSMITLALAQMIYLTFFQATELTGGSNGRSFPDVSGAFGPLVPGQGGLVFYLFAVLVFLATLFIVRRIIRSPFGRILIAIRENSDRAEALGYDVKRILFVAFVFTSIIGGFAGVMYGILFSFVSPNVLFWLTSGEVVLMTIIGGVGTLGGPLIGATIYILLSDSLTDFFNFWEIPFGIIIIAVVIFAPKGLYGIYLDYVSEEQNGYTVRRLFDRFREQLNELAGRK
jgi:branched-chain amino acid transport system permease protein